MIDAATATGGRAHVLHLSSADALPELHAARAGRRRRLGRDLPALPGRRRRARSPTARRSSSAARRSATPRNQDRLWAALADGDIDLIVSDHSPCTAELKRFDTGDFGAAWGGIASVQVGLPVVWTAARRRGHDLADVVRWMATAPADRVGLAHKGRIAVGADADLCVFDPGRASSSSTRTRLLHKNPVCAYAGRRLHRRGPRDLAARRGVSTPDGAPRGRLLTRGQR